MSCPSLPSSFLPADRWIADEPLLRLPIIGPVSTEAMRRFVSAAGFVLLLVALGVDLVHPFDVIPGYEDVPAYQFCIVGCLLLALPRLVAQFRFDSLRANAVSCLVLILVVTAGLSQLAHGNLYDARQSAVMMGKLALLYFAILATVNSPKRLRITLAAVAAFVLVMSVLGLLQYYGFVDLQRISHIERHTFDSDAGAVTVLVRLCGTGLFNDPNDLAVMLVFTAIVCGYFLNDPAIRPGNRILFLVPIALCAYGLYLTHSRGGMLSAVAGVLVFVWARHGRRNALAMLCLMLPLLFAATRGGSEGVDLDNPEDTFQARLELWSESFEVMRSAPLTGIGVGRLDDEIGHVAHNSYLHAFTELGLLGGIAFAGVFYLVQGGVRRAEPNDSELARMRPYMLAMVAAYAAGILSLSRCYKVPTILVIAIGTAYLALAAREGPAVVPRMDRACVRRVTGCGLLLLAATYVFVRLMLNRGGS